MTVPQGWQNPIVAGLRQIQKNVDPRALLPGRFDLIRARLEFQRSLLRAGRNRYTPIKVTREGVICDGHHAVRAAAEEGVNVEVLVVDQSALATGTSILDLPVR